MARGETDDVPGSLLLEIIEDSEDFNNAGGSRSDGDSKITAKGEDGGEESDADARARASAIGIAERIDGGGERHLRPT